MSFDAVACEVERGTLPLLLTYPVSRREILLGKLVAHLAVLILALVASATARRRHRRVRDRAGRSRRELPALWRLTPTSALLGATFLGIGYALSALARRPSGAAGLAIAVWLGLVVLFNLGLLAAVVADDGGAFTSDVFPLALLANQTDAFRLFNLAAADATAAGVGGAAATIPLWQSLLSVALWPVAALGLAFLAFWRVVP